MIEVIILVIAFFIGFLIYKESEEEFPGIEKGVRIFENILLFILLISQVVLLILNFNNFLLILSIMTLVLLLLLIKRFNLLVLMGLGILISLAYSSKGYYPLIFSFLILLSLFQGRTLRI